MYYTRGSIELKPTTTSLIIIMIIIYFIGLFFIGGPYESVLYSWFLGFPGIISPGLITSNFTHIQLLHLIANLIFLYMIGSRLESIVSRETYIELICYTAIGIGAINFLIGFSPSLGFSGINMGLLSYHYWYYSRYNYTGQQDLQLLIGNIMIGFLPGISLLGHVVGAVMGILFGMMPRISKR